MRLLTRSAGKARRIAIVSGLVATGAAAAFAMSRDPEADVPQYQRKAAAELACKAAATEISSLRLQSPIKFADDCSPPRIAPVADRPGYLIVTRVVEEQVSPHNVRRKTYSALMDGRGTDAWHMLQVAAASNRATETE